MRSLLTVVALASIGLWAQPVFAQRGGGHAGGGGFHGGGGGFHGGGGGFHGGGGGFHGGGGFGGGGFHGGGFSGGGRAFTGFHGGGFSGRGGFGGRGFGGRGFSGRGFGGRGFGGRGFGGRGFGFRGRGFGFGRGRGFGFGFPWWGFGYGWGYPYGFYGYPYYYAPYPDYYPYDYDSYDSPDPYYGSGDPPPIDPDARRQPNQYRPARPGQGPSQSGQAEPQGAGDITYPNNGTASYEQRPRVLSVDRIFTASPSAYRMTSRNAEQRGAQSDIPVRPEVQRARQRLREMPPFAREREIEARYIQFSPEEKELLRSGD